MKQPVFSLRWFGGLCNVSGCDESQNHVHLVHQGRITEVVVNSTDYLEWKLKEEYSDSVSKGGRAKLLARAKALGVPKDMTPDEREEVEAYNFCHQSLPSQKADS